MTEISDKKIYISELICAIIIAACGIFLTLAGLDVFPFTLERCWLSAVLCSLFAMSLVVSLIQKNPICIFLAWLFGTIACAQVGALFFTYRCVYPLFVAALPMAGAGVSPYTHYTKKLLAVSLVTEIGAFILFIESTKLLSAGVVLPLEAIYFGAVGVVYAARRLIKYHKENDR